MTRHARHWLGSLIVLAGITLNSACLTTASETNASDALRQQMLDAYGRTALASLDSLYFLDEYRETFRGQGYTPGYDDFWVVRSETILDLNGQRGSYESWSDQYGRIMQFHTLSTSNGIANIDYETGFYGLDPEGTYYQFFGRNIRASDTLLAHELTKPDSAIEHFDDRIYLGRAHAHVALTVPASPPLHLYIDKATGFIQRMHRSLQNGVNVVYVFENHQRHKGLVFAKEYRVFIDGELLLVTRERQINTNLSDRALTSAFTLSPELKPEPQRVEFAQMQVDAVSDRLHHVGQNDHTSFYDAGEYIIGLGGYGGLTERFEAYQKALGHTKPLRYQLATHHHSDHTAGLAEAAELGARIVMPKAIREKIQSDHPSVKDEQIVAYEKDYQIDGIQLHVVSTSHAETMAVIYVPEAKTLFQEDHYVRMFNDVPGAITRNSYTLYQSVKPLNLDIETLLSVHVGYIESWDTFAKQAEQYTLTTCYMNRPLCP